MIKKLPFTNSQIKKAIKKFPTPVYVYDEEGIRNSARALSNAFSWANGFKNYFAVKATPNPYILKILKEEGCGVDCSSFPELVLAEKTGFRGEDIMFTSNDTAAEEFVKARQMNAIINLDDITHISFLEKHAGIPEFICFRYNPGGMRFGNSIIGKARQSKFGLTKKQIFEAYRIVKDKGAKRFGLHAMLSANELNSQYFISAAKLLFDLAVEIRRKVGIKLEFINLGGGIGIPYRPEQKPVDLNLLSGEIKKEYNKKIVANGLPPKIVMECGRLITGPHGYLVAGVRHVAKKYRNFVGLDASMANLMRPGMYGAYHHITVLGKEKASCSNIYDVTGSLCENNDKFAIQRKLPKIEKEDILVIHDAGAHGHTMGFNYNGKLRSAELLMKQDGTFRLIRRAETSKDYFSTLKFKGAKLEF